MKPIKFSEQTIVIADDQPEYLPLSAYLYPNHSESPTHGQGRIACCWGLTWKERLRVLITGSIWQQVMTFNQPLQPQLLTAEKPDMPPFVEQ